MTRLLPARLRIGFRRHWPVILFVAAPVAAFAIPALAGYVVINNDDLVQNYPLRVLVGENLRHAHLPLWDPYLWSGTPLLAGFNAGAAFPATWLFAILPAKAAWVLDEITVYVAASLGLYTFLRLHRLTKLPSFIGALVFSYSGFMSSQLVHIDLVQGASMLPWALVGVNRIASAAPADRARRWVLLLGVAFGLVILAGSPESMLDGGIVLVVYALWLVWRNQGSRALLARRILTGLVLAVVLGAAQWLPGLVFTHDSQRAAFSYDFFASGSMDPRLFVFSLVPYLLGGYGRLGVPYYFGSFALAEVNSYVGVLALCASFALLSHRWRSHRLARDWQVWYVIIVFGLLLAVGSHTPFGHVLARIPFYGNQRLQTRNLLDVDLGLSILLAFWLDRVIAEREGSVPKRTISDRILPVLPVIAIITVFATYLGWGQTLARALGAPNHTAALVDPLLPYMAVTVTVAIAAGTLAAFTEILRPSLRIALLVLVVGVDLVYFNANQSWPTVAIPSTLTANGWQADTVASLTANRSRVGFFDPSLYDYTSYVTLAPADLNIIRKIPSINGYGSLVSNQYQLATGSHDQATIAAGVLRGSVPDRLNLGVLITRPAYLGHQVNPSTPAPVLPPSSNTSTGAGPPRPPPVPPTETGQERTWFFGRPVNLSEASIPLASSSSSMPVAGGVEIGAIRLTGGVTWASSIHRSTDSIQSGPLKVPAAVGLVVRNLGPATTFRPPTLDTTDLGKVVLDGQLQDDLQPPHWQFGGNIEAFSVFFNTQSRGWTWLLSPAGDTTSHSVARMAPASTTGEDSFHVTGSHTVVLVRSEVYAASWSAILSTRDGNTRTLPVHDVGGLQAVTIPPGNHQVHFVYRPFEAYVGILISAGCVIALCAFAVVVSLERRRAKRASAVHSLYHGYR